MPTFKRPPLTEPKRTIIDTYGQGRPDFGRGAGPGTPYHFAEVKPAAAQQNSAIKPTANRPALHFPSPTFDDSRINAIRKRLGWSL